jgi:hypothetical protein
MKIAQDVRDYAATFAPCCCAEQNAGFASSIRATNLAAAT